MTRRPLLAVLALPLVLALAGCNPGAPAPGDDPGSEAPGGDPTQEQPGGVDADLPDDALLAVSVTVTASNGATMTVLAVVRASTAWDDPAAADRPATMTAECSGYLDATVYEQNLWSFTLVDVTATTIDGDWPGGEGVNVFPDPEFALVADTGGLGETTFAADDVPHCYRLKTITQPGSGTIVVGLQGDTDAVGAAGGFTRWANHNYGFSAISAAENLSACELTVTPLGAEFGWDADVDQVIEKDLCRFGNFFEDVDF
jgi:hypothetical protein